LERHDPLAVVEGKVFLRQPVVEPQGQARSALWIYKELGARLGLADYFQYEDEEDYLRQQLAPLGVDLELLRLRGFVEPSNREPSGSAGYLFNTPSGKIEIYSETLARAGFSPWPTWEEPPAPPAGQFYLLTGKVGQHTQFATQNNLYLHKYQDEPRLWMNDEVASQRGLDDGDWVVVSSPVGQVKTRLQATPAIRPDCVYLPPGFGHLSKALRTAYGVGASDSDLHVTYTDPISGGQALSQTFVAVERAGSS
jgi:thiosulfate reductase/polysulfide reductase chain A